MKKTRTNILVVAISKRLAGRKGTLFVFATIALIMSLSLYIIFAERVRAYSITAKTDVLAIQALEHPLNHWELDYKGTLHDIFNDKIYNLQESEFVIKVTGGTELTVTTSESRNTLVVILNNNEDKSAATLYDDGKIINISSYAQIEIETEKSLILPFYGTTSIGDDVSPGIRNILHEGKIRIIEQVLGSDVRYEAGEFTLDAGDRVKLYENFDLGLESTVRGFLFHANGEMLAVNIHGDASIARVYRLGSSGYSVKSSLWQRIVNDPVIVSMTSLLAILFLMFEIFLALRKIVNKEHHEK